ncbi:ELWxxDGT repeat protein [Winogradskyella thalassocola]|uniref:Por secretion system C-terminal sorting domain-containing protein n=1 Tax=Winogradskyella thalassocola TaxID=262004 RepID=A0A1G8M9J8_9FLAO|nr:ELWxxDGT repeat protein [Winogradskyella thalassocola]SDI64614.1 Por secretion system C-terminal sorting domain-containing protein [Winogradskyella thalassocola]
MKYNFSFLLFILITRILTAQTIDASLIEINYHEDSDPQNFVAFQNGFYFTATDGSFENFGRELWYSDGTSEGTLMVKDIKHGQNSSSPSSLVVVNNTLYFTADDGVYGSELWKSDGTENGTIMVKDIRPNNNSSYNGPTNLIDFNGTLFFTATNDVDGYELWKSDGTEAGTIMIKDINSNGNGSPNNLFVFNNIIYFTANDGVNGTELWKSDGTEAGTAMVKDINANYSGLSSGNQFLSLNNFFYFFADNGTNGYELWKSDGTESGTTIVKDIRIGSNSSANSLKGSTLNNIIIFEANDGINGTELWKSDGTEAGTSMVKNINNTNFNSISYNSQYISFNNEVYFLADDNIHGTEIWKSDGTETGTYLLKDINDGNSSVWIEKFHLDYVNNKLLFFTTSTNSSDRTLWVSDGSSNGTFELSDITDSNISGLEESFVTVNNATVLTGKNETNGNELWVTDGTITGTSFFADLNYSNSSNASKFTNVGGDLFFRARGTEYGNQLFKSDGTESGTQIVKDINPGYNCIDDPSEMKEINGILYFSAIDGTHGYELWRSDGTDSGTFMVKDIRTGNQSSMQNYNDQQKFTVLNDILYFNANDGINGFELWRSDGTESGTYMIKNINTSSNYNYGSHAREFVMLNNTVYFIANDNSGSGLWTTDGTESGTNKIINLNDMRVLKTVNNKLIIVAETSGTTYGPHDVWVSDGTASGTNHLQSFGDNIDSSIQFTTILNDELYFVAKSPNSFRKAVYKTNGTVSGTNILFDGANHATMPDLDIDLIMTCSNYVYFPVQNSFNTEKELWRTNGTITEQVAGPDTTDFLYIRNLTCYNNNLLYLTESFPHKIWITNDNLNEPLQLDVNILNGPNFENYNSIEEMGATDNHLYFRARNDISGNELYVTDIDVSTLSMNDYEATENNNFNLVRLYPNPTENFITIESITNSNIEKFEIWDLSGKMMHKESKKDLASINYDTNKLSGGIYFVKVFLTDNKIETLKLIVNH